jgi:3-oxoacyl-(acyl-carrier-protein) synthase
MAGATLRGQSLSIKKALQRANIDPKDVKVAYLHLTGTPDGDHNEAAAIRSVF